ncbi:hypothetical protein RHSIM_Rhsim13G0011000 [Rhododendron simsii]|uniref:UspA domain-containing protein n=1 Tax=Rhododendron simsii TaxID=118357 RepID=A0A834G034_RHOSS|nr:hypothetical protein RHSIM_Rhsim13G0011000 [Rhododendron simsii]
MATAEKPVMVVGIDDSEHSIYALEWALTHFFTPLAPNFPFNLVVLHAKPSATSAVGLAGPGAADVLPYVEADLKKIASKVLEKAKEICLSKSVILNLDLLSSTSVFPFDSLPSGLKCGHLCEFPLPNVLYERSFSMQVNEVILEAVEGDPRNVLCEAVEKHHASMLVVGNHGYGAIKRAVLGSVSDYCAHHAHCTVMIVKKPKIKH